MVEDWTNPEQPETKLGDEVVEGLCFRFKSSWMWRNSFEGGAVTPLCTPTGLVVAVQEPLGGLWTKLV